MGYKIYKTVFELAWIKNNSLMSNIQHLFARNFTIHPNPACYRLFSMRNKKALEYLELKNSILRAGSSPSITIQELYEILLNKYLMMQNLDMNDKSIDAELYNKLRFVIGKIEEAEPELKIRGRDIAAAFWEASIKELRCPPLRC